MPKFDFKKNANNFIEIVLPHGCSPANVLHIFRTTFLNPDVYVHVHNS